MDTLLADIAEVERMLKALVKSLENTNGVKIYPTWRNSKPTVDA